MEKHIETALRKGKYIEDKDVVILFLNCIHYLKECCEGTVIELNKTIRPQRHS